MKNYNRLLAAAASFCIFIAALTGYALYRHSEEKERMYNIEISRIHNSLSEGISPDRLDLRSYKYVEEISFLKASEAEDEALAKAFYQKKNSLDMQIRPLYEMGSLKGYFRYDYLRPGDQTYMAFLIAELSVLALSLFLIGILLYLRHRLIKPFHRMSDLPYELAKGHLKGDVKEEKSRYFGRFLWGIGLLKDQLDVTKQREHELEREKKLMLLSLSHDIKTPLNTIKLYSQALEEDIYGEEEKKKHAARQIGVKSKEIEQYVEKIIKTSKEDILNIEVHIEDFYLKDLILKVLETYKEKCAVRMLNLTVGPFENRLLKGDMDRAMEVFENIIENAYKYGDGRELEFTFYEEDYCQLIRIYSTGTPVTDTEFNHIFESFFRGANSEGRQGNGLGLYICREIMRKMDGEIFAEKDAEGMAFVLVFR